MAASGGGMPRFQSAPSNEQGLVELSVNRPATTGYLDALARLLPKLDADRRYPSLQDFSVPEGPAWAREVLGGWFARIAGIARPDDVILTNGAQHGLSCVLGAIARPGDTILVDAVTYQGIGALCRSLNLNPVPVAMDRAGMVPDRLTVACRTYHPRAVFLVPTLHNPTTITMPLERKQAIARIARDERMLIIEDDVYRALKPDAPPSFASFAGDIAVHITSVSKSVAPGLRLGAVFAPSALSDDIASVLRTNCWSTSPLNALIATRLVEDGHMDRIIGGQRAEFAARQESVRQALVDFDVATDDDSTHVWLQLPEPWRANAFVRACLQHGVGVLSGEAFAIGRDHVPHAVRINVGAARSREELGRALAIIDGILKGNMRLLDLAV